MNDPFYLIQDDDIRRADALGDSVAGPMLATFARALREAKRERRASVAERTALVNLAKKNGATLAEIDATLNEARQAAEEAVYEHL